MILLFSNIREISVSRKQKQMAILLILVAVGIIGYYTVPHGPDDLSRHIELINEMGKNGYKWCINKSKYRYEIIINHLFFWAAKYGNYHILVSFVTVMTCAFLLISACLFQRKQKAGSGRLLFYLYLVFGIVFFRWIVTGIRNYFSLSVFALGFAIEYGREKIPLPTWLCYIASILIHRSMIIFFSLRFFLSLMNRFRLIKVYFAIWGIGSLFVGRLIMMLPGRFFLSLGKILLDYRTYTNYDLRLYIVKLLLVIVMGMILFRYRKRNVTDKWTDFILFVYLFTLGSFPVMVLFERSVTCMIVLSCPVLLRENRFEKCSFILHGSLAFLMAGLYAYQLVDAVHNFSVIKMLY